MKFKLKIHRIGPREIQYQKNESTVTHSTRKQMKTSSLQSRYLPFINPVRIELVFQLKKTGGGGVIWSITIDPVLKLKLSYGSCLYLICDKIDDFIIMVFL